MSASPFLPVTFSSCSFQSLWLELLGQDIPDRPLVQQMSFIKAQIKWEEILSGVLGGGTCWLAKFLERKSAGMFTFECVSEQPV